MNGKVFEEGTVHEPIITLMFIAYWYHQNRGMSVCLKVIFGT